MDMEKQNRCSSQKEEFLEKPSTSIQTSTPLDDATMSKSDTIDPRLIDARAMTENQDDMHIPCEVQFLPFPCKNDHKASNEKMVSESNEDEFNRLCAEVEMNYRCRDTHTHSQEVEKHDKDAKHSEPDLWVDGSEEQCYSNVSVCGSDFSLYQSENMSDCISLSICDSDIPSPGRDVCLNRLQNGRDDSKILIIEGKRIGPEPKTESPSLSGEYPLASCSGNYDYQYDSDDSVDDSEYAEETEEIVPTEEIEGHIIENLDVRGVKKPIHETQEQGTSLAEPMDDLYEEDLIKGDSFTGDDTSQLSVTGLGVDVKCNKYCFELDDEEFEEKSVHDDIYEEDLSADSRPVERTSGSDLEVKGKAIQNIKMVQSNYHIQQEQNRKSLIKQTAKTEFHYSDISSDEEEDKNDENGHPKQEIQQDIQLTGLKDREKAFEICEPSCSYSNYNPKHAVPHRTNEPYMMPSLSTLDSDITLQYPRDDSDRACIDLLLKSISQMTVTADTLNKLIAHFERNRFHLKDIDMFADTFKSLNLLTSSLLLNSTHVSRFLQMIINKTFDAISSCNAVQSIPVSSKNTGDTHNKCLAWLMSSETPSSTPVSTDVAMTEVGKGKTTKAVKRKQGKDDIGTFSPQKKLKIQNAQLSRCKNIGTSFDANIKFPQKQGKERKNSGKNTRGKVNKSCQAETQNDQSGNLPLDEETKQKYNQYAVPENQNEKPSITPKKVRFTDNISVIESTEQNRTQNDGETLTAAIDADNDAAKDTLNKVTESSKTDDKGIPKTQKISRCDTQETNAKEKPVDNGSELYSVQKRSGPNMSNSVPKVNVWDKDTSPLKPTFKTTIPPGKRPGDNVNAIKQNWSNQKAECGLISTQSIQNENISNFLPPPTTSAIRNNALVNPLNAQAKCTIAKYDIKRPLSNTSLPTMSLEMHSRQTSPHIWSQVRQANPTATKAAVESVHNISNCQKRIHILQNGVKSSQRNTTNPTTNIMNTAGIAIPIVLSDGRNSQNNLHTVLVPWNAVGSTLGVHAHSGPLEVNKKSSKPVRNVQTLAKKPLLKCSIGTQTSNPKKDSLTTAQVVDIKDKFLAFVEQHSGKFQPISNPREPKQSTGIAKTGPVVKGRIKGIAPKTLSLPVQVETSAPSAAKETLQNSGLSDVNPGCKISQTAKHLEASTNTVDAIKSPLTASVLVTEGISPISPKAFGIATTDKAIPGKLGTSVVLPGNILQKEPQQLTESPHSSSIHNTPAANLKDTVFKHWSSSCGKDSHDSMTTKQQGEGDAESKLKQRTPNSAAFRNRNRPRRSFPTSLEESDEESTGSVTVDLDEGTVSMHFNSDSPSCKQRKSKGKAKKRLTLDESSKVIPTKRNGMLKDVFQEEQAKRGNRRTSAADKQGSLIRISSPRKRTRKASETKCGSGINSPSCEEITPSKTRGFQYYKECSDIVTEMKEHPNGEHFCCEVSAKEVPDYHKIVKFPMCLNVISYKLKNRKYNELSEVVHDIRRIFYNCRLYNKPPSPVLVHCDTLEEFFEDKLEKIFPQMDFKEISGAPPLAEKTLVVRSKNRPECGHSTNMDASEDSDSFSPSINGALRPLLG